MKLVLLLLTCSVFLFSNIINAQTKPIDSDMLVGHWTIDMSPQDTTDQNFAEMTITEVGDGTFSGEFYSKGVEIKNAKINTQLGIVYCAFTSGDGSGAYNSTFYFEDGILHGTTHSLGRNFLAVWTATKSGE